ncbi:hypothetical protein LSH36_91g09006 [Paralvinella palmiformis]|uniref:SCP domain-containing protein n=1 Tax=Paralvinella palmiformis TaxID=53620 RepID=A0AAD9K1V8_9ANNE|nr:hypothetical protein LSH36_91g09006 [Paralvinella palmiformis]
MFQLECLICYLIIQSSAGLLPQTTLSKEDQEEIVNVHNEYRRLEGASNMELLLVWATAKQIGCGFTKCLPEIGSTVFVCLYIPFGKYTGVRPYQKGPGCANCTSGLRWCDRGLCNSRCTKAGPGCGK